MKQVWKLVGSALALLLKVAVGCLCLTLTCSVLLSFLMTGGASRGTAQNSDKDYALTDRYNMFVTNTLSDTLEGVLSIPKTYWLNDDDLVAPKPNPDCYGTAKDPASLMWLLDEAATLLDGQETLFSAETPIYEGSAIQYYYDETILVITWKQLIDNAVYTVSEVKIADPSQFRRFVADGVYGSSSKYVPTEMASSVNAVLATNGDFYSFRNMGTIVYDSKLMRAEGYSMDSCFIAGNGDLIFSHVGRLTTKEAMQQLIDDNGVRFSLAFGPVLVENSQLCWIKDPYPVGEGNYYYPRMALCQRDTLHYLMVTVSQEPPYENAHTLPIFAENLLDMGSKMAYNLDGGQSATIVMNNKTVNYVWQRKVSDIIYFATAIPNGG